MSANLHMGSGEGMQGSDAVVLLVDDEPLVLEVQRRILERNGLRCLVAQSGEEAEATLRAHPEIDLVMLDAVLPDHGGFEVLQTLRGVKPSIKVIATSGMLAEGPVQAMMDAGADGFLPKPFRSDELLKQMNRVLVRTA